MRVLFSVRFKRMYRKLPQKLKLKTKERFLLFEIAPFHPILDNHPLRGEYKGCRSINITGDWRAIYEPEANGAWFIKIGTHGELYE